LFFCWLHRVRRLNHLILVAVSYGLIQ